MVVGQVWLGADFAQEALFAGSKMLAYFCWLAHSHWSRKTSGLDCYWPPWSDDWLPSLLGWLWFWLRLAEQETLRPPAHANCFAAVRTCCYWMSVAGGSSKSSGIDGFYAVAAAESKFGAAKRSFMRCEECQIHSPLQALRWRRHQELQQSVRSDYWFLSPGTLPKPLRTRVGTCCCGASIAIQMASYYKLLLVENYCWWEPLI